MLETSLIRPCPSFKTEFNKSTFLFSHQFHRHSIYDADSLVELTRRVEPKNAYWSTRPISVDSGWVNQSVHTSLEDTVRGIEETDSLVVLKDIEDDPVFGAIFKEALTMLPQLVGPVLQGDLVHGRATLLIASPRRVTGYHIDAESNFLLQLRGSKTVHVFDGGDRMLLSEHELEAFYAGDLNAARYKPERQEEATHYNFQPGCGIHVPIDWPHWVQNNDDVSVSISINYDLRSNMRRRKIYKINNRMRRLGLSPSTPGRFAWRDAGKVALFESLARARSLRVL